jgi:hypothetical protein
MGLKVEVVYRNQVLRHLHFYWWCYSLWENASNTYKK